MAYEKHTWTTGEIITYIVDTNYIHTANGVELEGQE